MKIICPLLLLLFFLGCSSDFTLEGPAQDIPVAYGFIDAEAEVNYLRVQKAFLEAGGDATQIAGDPNAIYYAPEDVNVTITNLDLNLTEELDRIDGREEGIRREDGTFATEPNVLYRLRERDLDLRPGQEVEVRIARPNEDDAVARLTLLAPLVINRPRGSVRINEYNIDLNINWSRGPNAQLFDVRLYYNIREFPRNGGDATEVRLEHIIQSDVAVNERSTDQITLGVDPESIFQFLGDNLEADPDVLRVFDDFDVRVTAAGPEALDRLTLETANTGITSSQALPRYTNLSGGIGLITGRTSTLREGIEIDDRSLDSLRRGFYTGELGFQ